ncbi:microcephalin [Archocentrus centrarchus]|uniref:microcephalin n=1 Tax=Archocentrus centrarchus TaxID=63155 RepID=UPI0011E9EC23|nr:microcephalin [Archocentrus centrarchus]
MTTTTNSSVLKDVVAYVDVWSSNKTANYSKPFIQQLLEMGAQVSKTFNKQVTHVVFNNGHSATWRKAKKSNVHLVSVLWVGRCYDDGVRVDEELYPALNDESNPVLKNKKHRCMQPKDSPERTPENDRRMRKKLDKMMKDFAPKEPLVTDVSPIIIDEENGIVYSPAFKRSDYMAQRLKDMKDKRENLSPTASQMVESPSPTGLKPSLGSTPTVLKLMYDQSDDDSSASVAELGYSPDKEEGRTHTDVRDHEHLELPHRKDCLSPCHHVPERVISVPTCPDSENKKDKERKKQKKSQRTSVRKKETIDTVEFLESPCQGRISDNSKNLQKERRQSQIKSPRLSPNKSEKRKQKITKVKFFAETKSLISPDTLESSSCHSSATQCDAAPGQKTPKQARQSFSALVRSFTSSSEYKRVTPGKADGDDDVFEDYFSPANQRSERLLSLNLPVESNIEIPFKLDAVPKKRRQRRSEIFGTQGQKKRKLEESDTGKDQQSETSNETQSQQEEEEECLPALNNPSADKKLMGQPTTLPEDQTLSELKKNSDFNVPCHTVESRGNECTVTAGFTESPTEAEGNHNKQVGLSLQKMVNKTKAVRTLVMTSMPTEKQNTVVQVVKALGGFSIVDRVCESTTHVVSGEHRRTLNILLGIAHGCWILSFEWILWSLEQRQWIPEEPYELADQFPAAQICRLQRHLSAGEHQQDLFQGQPAMFVSQHSQPPTQSLVELIELCGGTVCKTVRQAGICIGKYSGRRPEGSRILSEQWVLDSITHLKQLSYDDYELE